jgi:hypothetical protein
MEHAFVGSQNDVIKVLKCNYNKAKWGCLRMFIHCYVIKRRHERTAFQTAAFLSVTSTTCFLRFYFYIQVVDRKVYSSVEYLKEGVLSDFKQRLG